MNKIYFSFLCLFGIATTISAQELLVGWHKSGTDSLYGVRSDEALHELQQRRSGKTPSIIVGIIDSGIDTTAVSLKTALWTNEKELLNGKDDDGNGYVDDIHGWNFLGTADGTFNMVSAGTEEFREFKRLYPKYKSVDPSEAPNTPEYAYYEQMKRKAGIENYIKFVQFTAAKHVAYQYMDSILSVVPEMNKDTLTMQGLMAIPMSDPHWEEVSQMLLADLFQAPKTMRWNELLSKHEAQFNLMKKRLVSIESEPDKRLLMGDDLQNAEDRFYGNPVLQVDGYEHGTFVAGIIAGNGQGMPEAAGIYPAAKLMILRAVPDGDEYDKDVASAIRYAVDNGARVVNLSLGKYTSPRADMVNDAIAYAAAHDVLLIQASGNNGLDIDSVAYYPTARDASGKRYSNFLRVGASDSKGNLCSFSNYGAQEVDVLAPGEHITSVMQANDYEESQGTSVAAPIVTGVAAMLRAYFPKLTASEVKDILIRSVRPSAQTGSTLSGGVVDARAAVKLAIAYKK